VVGKCYFLTNCAFFLLHSELELSIPEDMATPVAEESAEVDLDETRDYLSINPAALPPGSPRKDWVSKIFVS